MPRSGVAVGTPARTRELALNWREFLLLLVLGDAAVTLACLLGVVAVWSRLPGFVPTELFDVWLVGTWCLWLVALRIGGAYDLLSPDVHDGRKGAIARALLIVAIATLAAYFLAPRSFPRSAALIAAPPVTIALLLFRTLVEARAARAPFLQRRVLLVGADSTTREVARVLSHPQRPVPYVVAAIVPDGGDATGLLVPIRGEERRLPELVRELRVREIVVGSHHSLSPGAQSALVECQRDGVAITDAAQLHEHLTARVLIADANAGQFAHLLSGRSRGFLIVKRLVDVIAATVLLVLLAPLYLAIAIAILLDDGPPIVFRQTRLGLRGEPFTIHKFRSMHREAERDGARYADRDDRRATRVGRFLRPSGLDELPQLWDVVRGKMSLIGPRPERPELVAQLAGPPPLYWARLAVRPGLVGWAEVHIPHALTAADHLDRLGYDLYYVKRASLLLDADVILRTVTLLLRGRR